MKSIQRFGWLFFLPLILAPHSSLAYKKVKSFVLQPPQQLLPGVQRIAVLDFEGEGTREIPDNDAKSTEDLVVSILSEIIDKEKAPADQVVNHGRIFSDYLISELVQNDRGIHEIKTGFLGLGSGREGKTLQEGTFTNIFDIVERAQLMQILEEQKLTASGIVNDNQVIELGGMLGVQALVVGNVGYSHQDSNYKQKRTRKKGNKTESYEVDCEKREVKVTVRARVISTETAKILGSKEASKSLTKSTCSDDSGTLPSIDDMIDEGLQALSIEVANFITPHYELQSHELEKIKTSKYKNSAEKAAKLAEELKIDEAYMIYKLIYDKDPYNPEVMYNLSVMHETVGNFDKAKSLAEMALQMKDEGRYKDAIKRLEKTQEFFKALAAIGIVIEEHTFEVNKSQAQKILAKKVKIKGSRDQRFEVRKEPDQSSEVVTRVPGDLTFTVIRRQGDWVLIKLLGDQQGYIHKDQVEFQ